MMASMRFDGSLGARQQPRQAVLEPTRRVALQQSRALLRTGAPQLDQADERSLSAFVPGAVLMRMPADSNPATPPRSTWKLLCRCLVTQVLPIAATLARLPLAVSIKVPAH